MAVVREVVEGTSEAARSAAALVIRAGDGLIGGVVAGMSGAANGLTGGATAGGGFAPSAAAGALGLVAWPLLALTAGSILVVRQLQRPPAPQSRTAAGPAQQSRGGRVRKATTPPRRGAPAARETGEYGTARKGGHIRDVGTPEVGAINLGPRRKRRGSAGDQGILGVVTLRCLQGAGFTTSGRWVHSASDR